MPIKLTKSELAKLKPKGKPYDTRDSVLTGFLVRTEKSGYQSFWYAYSFEGKRGFRVKLGSPPGVSVEGARALATIAAGQVAQGVNPQAAKVAQRVKAAKDAVSTLGAFVDKQYAPWACDKHRPKGMKTGARQISRIRKDFAEYWDKPMHTFSPFLIEGIRKRWRETRLPDTIDRDIQRLYAVFSRAVDWDVLDKHPLKGLKKLGKPTDAREYYLSAAEEVELRKALAAREDRLRDERANHRKRFTYIRKRPLLDGEFVDYLKPMVLVALNTGLRRGELFDLLWSDVNLGGKMISIRSAAAKSGKPRKVAMNAEAICVMTAWKARGSGEGLVFSGRNGQRRTTVNEAWYGVTKAAQLDHFRFHDLRHTFASRMVQNGVDLNTVRQLMGHADMKMTLRYGHLDPANLHAAVARNQAVA